MMNNFINNITTKKVTSNVVIVILSAISMGVLADSMDLVKFKWSNDDVSKDDVLNMLKEERSEYKSMYLDCNENYNRMRGEIETLKSSMLLVSTVQNDLPVPIWLKDVDSKVVFLNKSFENEFLKPFGYTNLDLINTRGEYIYSKELMGEFIKNDFAALNSSFPVIVMENYYVGPDGERSKNLVIKFRRMVGSTVIGTGGFAIKKENLKGIINAN